MPICAAHIYQQLSVFNVIFFEFSICYFVVNTIVYIKYCGFDAFYPLYSKITIVKCMFFYKNFLCF